MIAFALATEGCGEGEAGAIDAARAVEIAREHEAEVDAFERWARRIAAADTSFPSRAALEEAAFAPLRRERAVVGAWLSREGVDPWSIAMRPRASIPDTLAWRRARLGGLREYEIAAEGERHYVRARSETSGGAMLVVTIAFEPPRE